jgi:hypothetical protein
MATLMRRAGLGALIVCGMLAAQDVARAQSFRGVGVFGPGGVNRPLPPGVTGMGNPTVYTYGLNLTNPYVAQQQYLLSLRNAQAAINSGVAAPATAWLNAGFIPPGYPNYLGGAGGYAGFPPVGYPPTPPGGYPTPPIYNPGYGGYSGCGGSLYSPGGVGAVGLGGASGCGYLGSFGGSYGGGYGGYDGYGPNYYTIPEQIAEGVLMKSWGQLIKDQEQARILRQQYYQTKLETIKKKFDLDMYIKANTPTWTEEQAKLYRVTLKRIQTQSSIAEIYDGRAINYLLDDLERYRDKTPIGEFSLDESILKHLNIKPKGGQSNSLGILRDGGKLNWPSALVELLTPEVRTEMEARSQKLAQDAITGVEPDRNALKDLRIQIDQAMNQLLKKANYFDTEPYMQAKRYLQDLDSARKAIDFGGVSTQVQYQQCLAKGEIRSLNDFVRVMIGRGWRLAPALPDDRPAYSALHAALASYDVAMNQQAGATDQ